MIFYLEKKHTWLIVGLDELNNTEKGDEEKQPEGLT